MIPTETIERTPKPKRKSRAKGQDEAWLPGRPRTEAQSHILELLCVTREMDSHAIARALRKPHSAVLMMLARMQTDCTVWQVTKGKRGIGLHGAGIWTLREYKTKGNA